jgi:hypothetical protein
MVVTWAGWGRPDRVRWSTGAAPEEIIADYLLTYDRMKQRYDELGVRDQRAAVTELLAARDRVIDDA